MYYNFIHKVLSQLDPEIAHKLIFKQLKFIKNTPLQALIRQKLPENPVTCMGLRFKNILGLAAGLDKNGNYIDILDAMGFGFIEVGTVTPRPQHGCDRPRLFRLKEAEGFINRMGCNNFGIDNLVKNIQKIHFSGILGINIGRNENTPINLSKIDYLICMEKIYTYADYIAINISSPNTTELRRLQYGKALKDLIIALKKKQNMLNIIHNKYVPLVIKISPDLSDNELAYIADTLINHNIDGVIATNTTLDRSLVRNMNYCNEKGGLSGRPLQLRSTEIIRYLSKKLKGKLPIIGVGGIDSIISAREKIAAGATLIQVYSGFIYKGPSLIKEIVTHT